MRKSILIKGLMICWLLLMVPMVQAQTVTPSEGIPVPPPAESVDAVFASYVPLLWGVALLIAMVAMFVVAYQAQKSAGVNVSPEAIGAIADGLAGAIEKVLSQAEAVAAETDTPIDDAALDVAKYPVEAVVEFLRSLGYEVGEPAGVNPTEADS